jgi:hypothetical protein
VVRSRRELIKNESALVMDTRQQVFHDLVAATLAVNKFSLEKAVEVTSELQRAGLLDPSLLVRTTKEALSELLLKAGYRRSVFMAELMAARILKGASWLVANGTDNLKRLDADRRHDELRMTLLQIDGVGPTVVDNFMRLRESEP